MQNDVLLIINTQGQQLMFALKFVVCNKADVEQMFDNKTPELGLISSEVLKSITFTGLV